MKLALRRKPDAIWLLSDNITGSGAYQITQDDLLATFAKEKQVTHTTSVPIHTIQFIYPDPLGTSKAIADAHGGVHRFVSTDDLSIAR